MTMTERMQRLTALRQERAAKWDTISPGDYENLNSKFPARITALEDSLGDIAAALADIVEVTE